MPGRRVHPTIAAVVSVCLLAWSPVALATPAGDPDPEIETSPAELAPETEPTPEPAPAPTTMEIESEPKPEGGGMGGSVVAADDPAATQAQTDLEGEALDRNAAGVPERMPPLRTAAWWTMFGTVALGTVGGIFSGLAERQEDEAERLALGFDLESGARYEYEKYADEYESILERGNTYQWVSRGFLIAAGAALATSITLFAVQAKRERRERPIAIRGLSPLGLEVAF